jgi:hypothetical protein
MSGHHPSYLPNCQSQLGILPFLLEKTSVTVTVSIRLCTHGNPTAEQLAPHDTTRHVRELLLLLLLVGHAP